MLDNITTKISYAANGLLALLGVLSLESWAIVIGIVLSIATFIINKRYRQRMLNITKEHQRKMRNIHRGKTEHDPPDN